MRKLLSGLSLILFALIVLTNCGGGEKANSVRKMEPKLDSLITNLAACEEQNSNCDAYLKARDGITEMSKDTSYKNLVDDLFNGIAQSTSGARSAACAHAINFWSGTSEYYKNADYGRIVLDALKKEKYDENSYVGSTLGQLLSGWLATDDETLLKDIHAAVKDKNTEKRGRKELIRLSGDESFAKEGYLDMLIGIAGDVSEDEEVRLACLGVLWRAEDAAQVQKVESMYLGFLENDNPAIVGSSLIGLGYMKSVNGYAKVLEIIEELGANEDYVSSASISLSNYISYEAKEGIDTHKAFALAVKLANTTSLKPFYRSYYLSAIEAFGGNEAMSALTKLSADKEKDVSDPAKRALQRLKDKQ